METHLWLVKKQWPPEGASPPPPLPHLNPRFERSAVDKEEDLGLGEPQGPMEGDPPPISPVTFVLFVLKSKVKLGTTCGWALSQGCESSKHSKELCDLRDMLGKAQAEGRLVYAGARALQVSHPLPPYPSPVLWRPQRLTGPLPPSSTTQQSLDSTLNSDFLLCSSKNFRDPQGVAQKCVEGWGY